MQLPLGLAIALLLNRKMRGQGMLRTIIFVPYVLAEVIAGVVWFQLLQPEYGVIDTMLGAVGICAAPSRAGSAPPRYALYTVIVVLTWKYLGLAVLLFLAGLQGVPGRAATRPPRSTAPPGGRCSAGSRSRCSGPTIRTWAFLSMIGSLQLFDMVWILTGGGPANATTTMATFLITEGTKRHNYGIAAAASVILFVVALVLAAALPALRPAPRRRRTPHAGRRRPMSAVAVTARARRRRRADRADDGAGTYRGGNPLVYVRRPGRRRR